MKTGLLNKVFAYAALLLAGVFGTTTDAVAQENRILTENIHTLRVISGGDWEKLPVITLHATDSDAGSVEISFDDMTHRYHRYTYNIRHCTAEWQESDLNESDWLDGFNDQPIRSYQNSTNTTFQYTHYSLTLPNDDVTLKLSGNYLITITDENHTPVAQVALYVVEPIVAISAQVSGNTDTDTNLSHQQLSFEVGLGSLQPTDPERELIVKAAQNRRFGTWSQAKHNLKPTHVTTRSLQFTHNRDLIFNGGNEYRRFEIVDMYDYSMNVDRIDFHEPYFHATLMENTPARAYRYDRDHNGRFLIRHYNSPAGSDINADYVFVHFSLKMPFKTGGSIYLDGDFTYGELTEKWKLSYNSDTGCYETTALLKEGAYDYRYLWVYDGESAPQTGITEYDSYETLNEYCIMVYFRQRGSRYDRLVGFTDLRMNSGRE